MRPRSAPAARTREALRDAVQIYAPSTVYAVGLGAMTPALAVAALALGLDAARAAAVVLLVGLGSLVANGPASALAARAGERVTMVVSAVLGTAGAGLAWATTAGVSSGPSAAGVAEPGRLALFLAAVLAVGMAGAGFNLARQAYLAVAVPATHRARAMSTLGGTVRIGTFLGPFLGAAAQAPLGLDGAFAAAAAAMAVGALLCLRIRDLPVPASGPAAGGSPPRPVDPGCGTWRAPGAGRCSRPASVSWPSPPPARRATPSSRCGPRTWAWTRRRRRSSSAWPARRTCCSSTPRVGSWTASAGAPWRCRA